MRVTQTGSEMFREAGFGDGVAPLPLFSRKNRINKDLALVLWICSTWGSGVTSLFLVGACPSLLMESATTAWRHLFRLEISKNGLFEWRWAREWGRARWVAARSFHLLLLL
jgi:hypothetical protein